MKKKIFAAIAGACVLSFALTAVLMVNKFQTGKLQIEGSTLRVYSSQDISTGAFADGAQKFAEKYGCSIEFTDNSDESDLIFSSGEDFSRCQPIDKYINPRNRLYTRRIIEDSCTKNDKIYGISNALIGRINYCTYNPAQFDGIEIPYERYLRGDWTWDNFIAMTDELGANVSVDWNNSYINMMYALKKDKDGKTQFEYASQEQVEWLNFVRTLIYDEGIVTNDEGAFKVGFLPELVLESVGGETAMRYIPWPSKNGKLSKIYVDEYHFCVPENAKNPKASVELANYMIESCVEVRSNLYKSQMTKEDYRLFKKQIDKIYVYPPHTADQYAPAQLFIDDFVHGKTVTEHIFNVENDAIHIK